jgi:hypothetical protein
MMITAKQLAFLLNISKSDANKKIMLILHQDYKQAKIEHEINPDGQIDAEIFEKKTGIPVLFALEDIKKNALKRKSYAKYLMKDFPESQISVSRPPKEVRLPSALRELLSKETLSEIEKYWNQKYYKVRISKWDKSVNYWPEFIP